MNAQVTHRKYHLVLVNLVFKPQKITDNFKPVQCILKFNLYNLRFFVMINSLKVPENPVKTALKSTFAETKIRTAKHQKV